MIRWCMYCQHFIGESFPYDDPGFSHGICQRCEGRAERGEPVMLETETARALMHRLLASARAAEERECEAFLEAAAKAGIKPDALCVGMLQPALYQAGRDWQCGRMSVAAEHRFTAWCERVFAMLPVPERRTPPVDLLILSTPGNAHHLGPRVAGRVLAERGFSVEVVVPALPFDEMESLARTLRPRVIGFSCALPSQLAAATGLIARLRERLAPAQCRFVVSGFALRMGAGSVPTLPDGVEAIIDLETFVVDVDASGTSAATN